MEVQIELIKENHHQRFYKFSTQLTKGVRLGEKINLIDEMVNERKVNLKPEYQYLITEGQGVDVICISNATTHIEKLVFAAIKFSDGEYARTRLHIAGKMTFMITGGCEKELYKDEVYLRYLCKLNGLKISKIILD